MGRLASRLPDTSQALAGVLRSKGFDVHDFELEEEGSPGPHDLFGIVEGLLHLRCASTGEERVYSIGYGSAWLGAFLADLSGGHFARAARDRLAPA